jgi:hypothetical protein
MLLLKIDKTVHVVFTFSNSTTKKLFMIYIINKLFHKYGESTQFTQKEITNELLTLMKIKIRKRGRREK